MTKKQKIIKIVLGILILLFVAAITFLIVYGITKGNNTAQEVTHCTGDTCKIGD